MPQETTAQAKKMADMREKLMHVLEHFEHILPAQAPIRDFVHHNTLHGFEHLSFPEALKSANELTGAYGYWPQEKFREKYQQGRMNDADIIQALANDASLDSELPLFKAGERQFYRKDIYRVALLYPIKNISSCQLRWKADEAHVFDKFNKDVPTATQEQLLKSAQSNGFDSESETLQALWSSCLNVLDLDAELLHPEDMMNLSPEQAGKMFNALSLEAQQQAEGDSTSERQRERQKAWKALECLLQESTQKDKNFSLSSLIKTLTGVDVQNDVLDRSKSKIEPLVHKASYEALDDLLEQVGSDITLRTFLKKVTGIDIQQEISVYLQPYLSNWMDQGFAAWNAEDRAVGFYQSWKKSALADENWVFSGISDWREHIESLPDDPVDTILAELGRMGISEDKWASYIERLALDLPGWSGMFYWRHSNPNYDGHATAVNMMDYLAVRLITEHLYARRLCRELWLVEANLTTLRGYFHYQHAEFLVRYTLNNEHLPEYLVGLSQQLAEHHSSHSDSSHEWRYLSHLIWTWQQTAEADGEQTYTLQHEGWKLFLIAQHLGLCSAELLTLEKDDVEAIFSCVETLDKEKIGFLLLQAYEHHYREEVFSAITQNQGRGTWKNREQRPEAQIIFCMDDREEGVRRHLEHLNPKIETLGAAAFFGVVMNWKSLDNDDAVVLCPVVVVPEHEIAEVPAEGHEQSAEKHKKRFALRAKFRNFIHQETRRNLLSTSALIGLNAPLALTRLVGKVFMPLSWGNTEKKLADSFDTDITTRITSTAKETLQARSIKNNQQGFTLEEQTNIVEGFLQNNGLLTGFSHFVVTMGHYSNNLNNPHTAAYGCGACGGKYSGPNGRAFAAMANNTEVRESLAKRDLHIPDDCWFVGAEHDTCNEDITWYDTDLIPTELQTAFEKLQSDLKQATGQSAHERCRKLASAPRKPTLKSAINHIAGRGVDFSQARPELGHATIACGFVGRRYISQGTFLDRRSFLISYDPNTDPDGKFLERILLTAGPVGAGINLEYYFSAVNNDKYGCSSKIVHNLSGLFGVMEGTASDLRTGLPQQMIEIHEPMRLQLMVEATTDVLTAIYMRQPSIQQLVGNGWLLLSAKDPESEVIHTFDPAKGWVRWESPDITIPTIEKSADWYAGHYDHLSPALIKRVTP